MQDSSITRFSSFPVGRAQAPRYGNGRGSLPTHVLQIENTNQYVVRPAVRNWEAFTLEVKTAASILRYKKYTNEPILFKLKTIQMLKRLKAMLCDLDPTYPTLTLNIRGLPVPGL